ncbi:MAG: hypothetical protein M3Y33_18995 [Actinomycetota bacterium]|nr:hypothetical protein [Actinomycetota bacterium]
MALQLAAGEPEAGPWRTEPLSTVIEALTGPGPGRAVWGRAVVLAVDGRSNGGKTTLAARIGDAVPGSAVVHADDIAWAHSRFGWADLLIEGILVPVRQGRAVSYRPPRWAEHGREGSIEVPADCPLLVIEGDGAGRREVADLIDVLIWVQSGECEAGRRALARIGKPDESPTLQDHREWMAEEMPFSTAQRTWERADVIVCGTPEIPCDPVTEIVVAPSLPPASALAGGSRLVLAGCGAGGFRGPGGLRHAGDGC